MTIAVVALDHRRGRSFRDNVTRTRSNPTAPTTPQRKKTIAATVSHIERPAPSTQGTAPQNAPRSIPVQTGSSNVPRNRTNINGPKHMAASIQSKTAGMALPA